MLGLLAYKHCLPSHHHRQDLFLHIIIDILLYHKKPSAFKALRHQFVNFLKLFCNQYSSKLRLNYTNQ